MESIENKKVIEIDGIKLTEKAIAEIFYLQHQFHKEPGAELNYKNNEIESDIHFINEANQIMIEMLFEDKERDHKINIVLWILNRYRDLLNSLRSIDNEQ